MRGPRAPSSRHSRPAAPSSIGPISPLRATGHRGQNQGDKNLRWTGEAVPVEFRVLGTFEIADDGVTRGLSAGGELTVLALLVLNAGRIVSADTLIDASWGENPPANP